MPNARVGLIIPSSNRMVEQEMVRWFPMDIQAHVNRLRMTGARHLAFPELLYRCTMPRAHSPTHGATSWRFTARRIRWNMARKARPPC